MKRSPMPRRRRRMAPRSAKRVRDYAGTANTEGRRELVARLLAERPVCEAGERVDGYRLGRHLAKHGGPEGFAARCEGAAVDVHEVLARSAGGSILDEANAVTTCRWCHSWIGRCPLEALALGLRRSRYDGRNTQQGEDTWQA